MIGLTWQGDSRAPLWLQDQREAASSQGLEQSPLAEEPDAAQQADPGLFPKDDKEGREPPPEESAPASEAAMTRKTPSSWSNEEKDAFMDCFKVSATRALIC